MCRKSTSSLSSVVRMLLLCLTGACAPKRGVGLRQFEGIIELFFSDVNHLRHHSTVSPSESRNQNKKQKNSDSPC